MSRKLDLSQFRGDDSDGEDDGIPRKRLELNDLKSRTFTHGITKKSKKDLEKEAEERKRIEEEKAAALVLAEYADAFDKPSGTTSAMRGGYAGFGRGRGMGGGFVRAGETAPAPAPYEPPRGPAAMGYARMGRPQPKAPSPPPTSVPKPKGKRAMDSFLEEIKGNQVAREQRLGKMAKMEGSSVTALAAWETNSGGRAFTEQESTNLFVGNLPHSVTEEFLGRFFAKLGPVGTVKIMWPRGDQEQSIGSDMSSTRRFKAGLQGFVAYMKRSDAEQAVKELDGMDCGGSIIKVGWSKPVPTPQKALYEMPASRDNSRLGPSRSRARSPIQGRSHSPSPQPRSSKRLMSSEESRPSRQRRSRSGSYSSRSSRSRSSSRSPPPKKHSATDKWLSKVPEEDRNFIKAVVAKVKQHGGGFEEMLRTREKANPKFKFLFNKESPDFHLYRISLDSRYRVPLPPLDFEDEGYASMYSSDSAEDSERESVEKGKVGKLARRRFEAMLRLMSGKRAEIARAMEFAMKRAEAADEISDTICLSLRLDSTPVPRKMARLHLVSDILHNSASPLPNVWKYRLAFEQRLPAVFAHLAAVSNSLQAYSGNISADVFRSQVCAVLDIWDRWIVFTTEVLEKLRGLFSGTISEDARDSTEETNTIQSKSNDTHIRTTEMTGFKTSGFKSSFKPLSAAPDTGVSIGGTSVKEDLDGDPMDGANEEHMDGEPMDEDVDGEVMDEDLDGEAM